jgi:hypothetical protein
LTRNIANEVLRLIRQDTAFPSVIATPIQEFHIQLKSSTHYARLLQDLVTRKAWGRVIFSRTDNSVVVYDEDGDEVDRIPYHNADVKNRYALLHLILLEGTTDVLLRYRSYLSEHPAAELTYFQDDTPELVN